MRKLRMPTGVTFRMDRDVASVLEFILMNIASSKCIKVANAVKELAPLVFRQYNEENTFNEERFIPLAIIPPDISQ